MKLTADTITDQQIHALRREAVGTSLNDTDPDLMHICEVALYGVADRTAARARCAEILNARAEGRS